MGIKLLAEREGFEPSKQKMFTRFPSVRLQPLGHLSSLIKIRDLLYSSSSWSISTLLSAISSVSA